MLAGMPVAARAWCLLAALVVTACGPSGSPGKDATAAAADASIQCPAAQTRPDGTCCPAGEFFNSAAMVCTAAGPPECAAEVFGASAADCTPRWCGERLDDKGQPCAGDAWDACSTRGRTCSGAELAAGGGCLAGEHPGAGGSCHVAGSLVILPGGESVHAEGGAASPLQAPPAVPAVAVPRTCLGEACADGESGCPVGDVLRDGACQTRSGVPWSCPPGFLALATGAPPNTPCQADPGDCGDDLFGGVQDGAGTRFVDPKAPASTADGTRAHPFASLTAAAASMQGGTLVLAGGDYLATALVLPAGVALGGRCAALTHLWGTPAAPTLQILAKNGKGNKIERVTVHGGHYGINAGYGTHLTLARVRVTASISTGINAYPGSVVTLQDVAVDGSQPNAAGQTGNGIEALGANMTLTDVRISGQKADGLLVDFGATVTGTRIALEGGHGLAKLHARGIGVGAGNLELRGARIAGQQGVGLHALDKASVVDAEDLAVFGPESGAGIVARHGAHIVLRGVWLGKHSVAALYAETAGSLIEASDMRVENGVGEGVLAEQGGKILLDLVDLHGCRASGLQASGVGTEIAMSRGLVRNTKLGAAGQVSGGVVAADGALVTLDHVRASGNSDFGIVGTGPGTRLEAVDVLADGQIETAGHDSGGFAVQDHAVLYARRIRASANPMFGITALDGSALRLVDVVVDGTLAPTLLDSPGSGIAVVAHCTLVAERLRVHGNTTAGITATEQSDVRLVDVGVDGTVPWGADGHFGDGIDVGTGVTLGIAGGWVGDVHEVGILAEQSSVALAGVRVERTSTTPKGLYGAGISVASGKLDMVSCRIHDNHAAGIVASLSQVSILGSVVATTQDSTFLRRGKPDVRVGDGIEALACPTFTLTRSLIADNSRVGLLVSGPTVSSLTGCVIRGGVFGLATRAGAVPTRTDTLILGASQQAIADASGLYVPDSPQLPKPGVHAQP